ncbi:dTDP-4-dehydrorhamnose reductase [Pseudogulbenkiania sp. NH8B]|uniref:dTDP-4-dehydrorhamnose reductase n=1 Tax=Pseudogulbenkiania sp. (strain NH8B) TaxID=748280 RepID=UPI000227A597|nr:dTDP-4-dehydrorhamnose reductase [Pseudogulbenkiania sp. NH8B]BAK78290.1 dTDP-4-dehydrorhamnose reductase [Pseudogulbenkiania sp. NH8B]
MSRILVTGANGQVGFELKRALAPLGDVIAPTRQEMDLANPASVLSALDRYQPAIIVNPAAYTSVDKAETDVELATAVNAHAPGIMAEWAEQHDALLIHYSTDYVFDGGKDGAYYEDDATNPQSVYGRSKWEGEQAIRAHTAHHLILRTSWVVGAYGSNFLKTILRLAHERDSLNVVADQIGAPTPAALIADITAQLISRYQLPTHKFDYGTYHLTASGETSWFEYARFVVRLAEQQRYPLRLLPGAIQPIPTSAYPLPAPRPANSRLDCSKLSRHFGLALPHWQQGVADVVSQLCKYEESINA